MQSYYDITIFPVLYTTSRDLFILTSPPSSPSLVPWSPIYSPLSWQWTSQTKSLRVCFPVSYHCLCFIGSSLLSGSNPNSLIQHKNSSGSYCIQASLINLLQKLSARFPRSLCLYTHCAFYLGNSALSFKTKLQEAFLNHPPDPQSPGYVLVWCASRATCTHSPMY